MLTVIIAAIVTSVIVLFALMAWQPVFTPPDVGEPAPQDGIDGWDAARTSPVTAKTFSTGSLPARVITIREGREIWMDENRS